MFFKLFVSESKRTIDDMKNNKGIRDEIQKLKKKMVKASDKEVLEIKSQIKWLNGKLQNLS